MGMYNRYNFLKRKNRRYIILIKDRKRYVSFDRDLMILNYIGFKYNLKLMDTLNINYIVLEDLTILIEKKYDNNNYMKYLKLSYLSKILNKIGNI